MASKRRLRWIIFLLVILGLISIIPAFRSYQGYVLDTETRKPLEGVVVTIEYSATIIDKGQAVDASETLTDQNGYFYIRKKWWTYNPWAVAFSSEMTNIFKRGYKPVANTPWDALIPSNMPKNVWRIEEGKRYILLEKPDPDYQRRLSKLSVLPLTVRRKEMKLMKKEVEEEKKALLLSCGKEIQC